MTKSSVSASLHGIDDILNVDPDGAYFVNDPLQPARSENLSAQLSDEPAIPYITDLPLPFTRNSDKSLSIAHPQTVFYPSDSATVSALAKGSRTRGSAGQLHPWLRPPVIPPNLTAGACSARFAIRRHIFRAKPLRVSVASADPTARTVGHITVQFAKSAPVSTRFKFRSRGSAQILMTGTMSALSYPFVYGVPFNGNDAAYPDFYLEHLNQGWSAGFALYVGVPFEAAKLEVARLTGSRLGGNSPSAPSSVPLLPVAALFEHQSLPLLSELKGVRFPTEAIFDLGGSLGTTDVYTLRSIAEQIPLGRPRATMEDGPDVVHAYLQSNYGSLSPGIGYAFTELRQSGALDRQTASSGLQGAYAGGNKYRTLRTPAQIFTHLAPSQFYDRTHPRPLAFDNDTLKHLTTPLLPGIASDFFMFDFGGDNADWVEAAREGGLVQLIRATVTENFSTGDDGADEILTLRFAWQAYYRMLLGYFYRFGGDHTVIEGKPGFSHEDAAKRRDAVDVYGATCVHPNAFMSLLASLRLVSNWLIEANENALLPMEPEIVAGMKLAHPFALKDDEHYQPITIGYPTFKLRDARSDPLRELRGRLMSPRLRRRTRRKMKYGVIRKSIVQREPTDAERSAVPPPGVDFETYALENGLAYDRSLRDVYTRTRIGADYCVSPMNGDPVTLPGVQVFSLGNWLMTTTAAYLAKACSNVHITDDARVAYGRAFDYGSERITLLAKDRIREFVGMQIDAQVPTNFYSFGVVKRGYELHKREGYTFDDWRKRYASFAEQNPNFIPPVRGRCMGIVNDHHLVLPTHTPMPYMTTPNSVTHIIQMLEMRAIVRLRMQSWFEYLNDAVHVYNHLYDETKMPSSQYMWVAHDANWRRVDVLPPEYFTSGDNGWLNMGPMHPEAILTGDNANAAMSLVTACWKKVDEWNDKIAALTEERKSTSYKDPATKARYYNISASIKWARKKIKELDDQIKELHEKADGDRGMALLLGLLLYDEPSNLRTADGELINNLSDHDEARHKLFLDKGRHRFKPWGSLGEMRGDSVGVKHRKASTVQDLIDNRHPVPDDVDPDLKLRVLEAIKDGTYFSPENVALLGARETVFDRTFTQLLEQEWAAPLREELACPESDFCVEHENPKAHTRGDSYQFALARAAYYFLCRTYDLLTQELTEGLTETFSAAFKLDDYGLRIDIAEDDPSLRESLKTAHARNVDLRSDLTIIGTEDSVLEACERLRKDHAAAFDLVRGNRLDKIADNPIERNIYAQELKDADGSGGPSLNLIDMVANSGNPDYEAVASNYLANYMEIETYLDGLAYAMKAAETIDPTTARKWKIARDAIMPYPSLLDGFEYGVSAALDASRAVDNQHQPHVFHYARAFAPLIEATSKKNRLTLSQQLALVDRAVAFINEDDCAPAQTVSYADTASDLSRHLAYLYISENLDVLSDEKTCLITMRNENIVDSDQFVETNAPPVLLGDWRMRVEAWEAANAKTRHRPGQASLLKRVRAGEFYTPRVWAETFAKGSQRIERVINTSKFDLDMGKAIPHHAGWPISDGSVAESVLRTQRRHLIREVMIALLSISEQDAQARKVCATPFGTVASVSTATINAFAHPWWHAAAAWAIKLHFSALPDPIDITFTSTELVSSALEFFNE